MNILALKNKGRSYRKKIVDALKSNKTGIEAIVVINPNENGCLCGENRR
jgi:hypothetical protein